MRKTSHRPKEVRDEMVRGKRIVTVTDKWSGDVVKIFFSDSGTGFSDNRVVDIRSDMTLLQKSHFAGSKMLQRAMRKAQREIDLRSL